MSRLREEDRTPSRVESYRGFGGVYAGTASLTHLLAHAGDTGPPVGESAVLAAGGGVGFSYNAYPGAWGVHVALDFAVPAGAGVVARASCDRLGAPAQVEETGNATAAERSLLRSLRDGHPCLLWGARGVLPYFRLREEVVPLVEHQWVVHGYDPESDCLLVADLSPRPLVVPRETIAAARATLFSAKHRKLTLERGRATVDADAAARRGLRAGLEAYRVPLLPGQGLNGLARWADLLVDTENPKGWPKLFSRWTGSHFYDALVSIYEAVELTHGGGALRGLLALYLTRAGASGPAARYRDLAAEWSALARAAMPSSVPHLGESRRLLSERDRLIRDVGPHSPEAKSRLAVLDDRLEELRRQAAAAPILTDGETADFRRDLSRRILDLHRAERAAADDLSAWLDG